MLLWITLVPLFTLMNQKISWILAITWIILVPLSRVIMGAHFLSDVTMGVAITFMLYVFLRYKYLKE